VDQGIILEIGTLDRTLYSDPWARLAAAPQGEPSCTSGRDRPRRSLSGSARRVLCFGQGVPVPRSSRPASHSLVVIWDIFFNTHYHGCSPSLIILPGPLRGETGPPLTSLLSIGLDHRCDRFGPGLDCRWKGCFGDHSSSTHGDGVCAGCRTARGKPRDKGYHDRSRGSDHGLSCHSGQTLRTILRAPTVCCPFSSRVHVDPP